VAVRGDNSPFSPTTLSGASGLYSTGTLRSVNSFGGNSSVAQTFTTTTGTIVMSNVNGDPVTCPGGGNPSYYFRQGQAVQFVPTDPSTSLGQTSWSITPSNGYATEGSILFVKRQQCARQ
jgi:hypothetical protein